jgi:hypothetical protein
MDGHYFQAKRLSGIQIQLIFQQQARNKGKMR